MQSFLTRSLTQPFWRLSAAVWLVFSALFFLRVRLHLDLLEAVLFSLFQLAVCISLAGILDRSYRKLDRDFRFGINTAAWIVGLSLLATLLQATAAHFLVMATGWHDPQWSVMELWLLRVIFFWLVFMLWSLLYFWIRAERIARTSERKAAEAVAGVQRMEIQLLRAQLDPHFVFNALNGIASVAPSDSNAASTMARELADYLRYSLDHRHDGVVPLDQEIEAMTAYLGVEQARFPEELHVKVQADQSARSYLLPCFLLQPLVENAVKHSRCSCEPPWDVTIDAETKGKTLCISVTNSGTLGRGVAGSGVGLEILRRRLEIHYPERHRLELAEGDGVVRATLELEGKPCSV